ncbi:MAG: hypothetical protein H7A37_03130 [Chlamydiales bacterium]|nr:hypothetical protein [Chlamydiia bacterium]MCP5507280.1 hypothetical protein [Chlamydiales bacterium]
MIIAQVTQTEVALYSMLILASFFLLFGFFVYFFWLGRGKPPLSPYSGRPLRLAIDIHYMTQEKVLRYLHYDIRQYDNRIFDFKKAAFCRETGRIFQNCVSWTGKIKLDWSFLNKRYPGNYVSWGSLTDEQKEEIRARHETLEGFQTMRSSPSPAPMAIEGEYAFAKPGPLYVDLTTKVLLGWKAVPGTELEVLIVQKPKRYF